MAPEVKEEEMWAELPGDRYSKERKELTEWGGGRSPCSLWVLKLGSAAKIFSVGLSGHEG